ncbi:MAG: PEP-CTERM sorting domain-containing protein [Pirellulales bacterium]|nr:PEP-CTERM sorting domain-containing protein [Pirellulales bacterium]
MCVIFFGQLACGEIDWSGDLSPANPTGWTTSTHASIGQSDSGMLEITGGTVSTYRGSIGYDPGSSGQVTVDGAGSMFTNSSNLYVGRGGSGVMDIIGGGSVDNDTGYIGYSANASGEVTVTGTGSTWTNGGSHYVGFLGNGTLSITDGGAVDNGFGFIGYALDSTGQVTVDGNGSTWKNSDGLYVGDAGDGTLTITGGGRVDVAGGLFVKYGGASYINMTGGGKLALYGDADGSLDEFLDLIDGSDAIRYWDHINAAWADITGATSGRDYWLSYVSEGDLAGYTVLTVERALIGDANHDGTVDDTDAALVAAGWQTGTGVTWEMGDFNCDGAVNEIDITLLAANWQRDVDDTGQSVPEPSMAVGLMWLVGICGWRRRKR